MRLTNLKNIVLFVLFFIGIHSGICQSSNKSQIDEQFEIKKEDADEKEEFEENDKVTTDGFFTKSKIFSNNNNQIENKKIQPNKIRTTKIGVLFSRIGIALKTYCQDNKISGKKALKILKLFN